MRQRFFHGAFWGLLVLLLLPAGALAAGLELTDVQLNNQRGPLSVLVKLSGEAPQATLRNDGKNTHILVLSGTTLVFQKGRTSKITVGGLGLEQIDIYPLKVKEEDQVRLELLLQEGFTVVDRTEAGLNVVRLDILPMPGSTPVKAKTPTAEKPKTHAATLPPPLPPVIEVAPPPKLPPDAVRPVSPGRAVTPPPVSPTSPEAATADTGAGNLRTDAATSGPSGVSSIEAKMLATRITNLNFRRADLEDVLSLLALKGGFNVVMAPGLTGQSTLSLNNVTVKEALDLLGRLNKFQYKVFQNTVLVTLNTKDEGVEPLETELLELSFVSPENVKTVVEGLSLIDRGKVQTMAPNSTGGDGRVDSTTTNVLMVKETPANLRLIREVVRKLDRKPRQVMVSVKFVEMEEGTLKTFFINPTISRTKGSRTSASSSIKFNDLAGTASDLLINIVGHHKGFNLNTVLRHQEQQNHLEVIAEPNLLTLDGKMGEVDLTEKTGFFLAGATANTTGNTQTRQTIDFGVKMKITPRIDREGSITMLVEPEVTTPGERGVDGLPNEKTKKVKLTVRVKSGETLMVGGLIQEEYEEIIRKAPLLGDIPILKKFFRSRSRDKSKKELVIFVTPTILEND